MLMITNSSKRLIDLKIRNISSKAFPKEGKQFLILNFRNSWIDIMNRVPEIKYTSLVDFNFCVFISVHP